MLSWLRTLATLSLLTGLARATGSLEESAFHSSATSTIVQLAKRQSTTPFCPAITPTGSVDVGVQALVSVHLQDEATVSATIGVGSLLSVFLAAHANVEVGVDVCLCLGANVGLAGIPINADVEAAAVAAVQADLRADAGLILNLLDGLIAVNGLRVTNRLTPTSKTPCGACKTNQYPTCVNGGCGCADCGPGETYNAEKGKCVLSPSAGSGSGSGGRGGRVRRLGLSDAYSSRQVRRDDVIKRLLAKEHKAMALRQLASH